MSWRGKILSHHAAKYGIMCKKENGKENECSSVLKNVEVCGTGHHDEGRHASTPCCNNLQDSMVNSIKVLKAFLRSSWVVLGAFGHVEYNCRSIYMCLSVSIRHAGEWIFFYLDEARLTKLTGIASYSLYICESGISLLI